MMDDFGNEVSFGMTHPTLMSYCRFVLLGVLEDKDGNALCDTDVLKFYGVI